MGTDYDLCINGGGPIGATLACLLARKGLRILLLERSPLSSTPAQNPDGRAYALAEGIRPLLEDAGIWQALPLPPQPINIIHVTDSQGRVPAASRSTIMDGLSFTNDDAPEDRPFGWMVEAHNLLAAIARTLTSQPGLDVRAPATGNFTFTPDEARITLNAGETVTASLVIAADGRQSLLRQQAGIGLTRIPYNKLALVSVLAHEHPHHGSALENFLPQGPFARLPLPGTDTHPHRSAIVWTDRPERIAHFRSLDAASFTRLVKDRLCGEDLGAIELIGKHWTYPLASQYAHRYYATRLLLAGDAAHGLHPVAGQGMNLGFRDVRTLDQILGEAHAQGQDLGAPALLQRYQRLSRPGNLAMLAGCDMMERLFSTNMPLIRHARHAGLMALKRLPTLRQGFVQRAMGL
ncbi:UbiH/UbiF/VisC/COQ6 family ubiquinone biosynthesis hydroxylase [Bombella sp. TMW 2.2543]|uniref:UbiH/UbiF/VisC/COQ6 family ubiquinone biosynthesis hydroxylase n=1 Tax=Bombella pluederhausensis TaxID=2967336 RepID=A0ABT3WJZ4_9PROT|nr:UbiH/UbiF/VisC/COQ6 family ubiquinone biosynthesis hydroxylase [Bombella pluederhausensis]MCX5618149.1 UbiH/UbiF/VisC/COQ6 family ubiquinone biosynthesis hydroxylase [Bombella pluederhausensis]